METFQIKQNRIRWTHTFDSHVNFYIRFINCTFIKFLFRLYTLHNTLTINLNHIQKEQWNKDKRATSKHPFVYGQTANNTIFTNLLQQKNIKLKNNLWTSTFSNTIHIRSNSKCYVPKNLITRKMIQLFHTKATKNRSRSSIRLLNNDSGLNGHVDYQSVKLTDIVLRFFAVTIPTIGPFNLAPGFALGYCLFLRFPQWF